MRDGSHEAHLRFRAFTLLPSAFLAAAFACLGLYALATSDGGHASHAAVLSLGFAAIAAYWLLAAGRLRRGEDQWRA